MRKIYLFMLTSVDGYFEGPNHDISWHNVDSQFNDFAIQQLNELDTILFGRRTYEMMEAYWPTESARKDDQVVANVMNTIHKIVFSKTVKEVKETEYWKNVQLFHDVNVEEIIALKNSEGKDMAIFGSSELCVSFIEKGLLDEAHIMVNPIILGKGTPLFHGVKEQVPMKLFNTKPFQNGNILLSYKIGL